MIYLDSEQLSATMHEVLEGMGVCDDSRIHLVNSIVSTSLRGVDSHGINLLPHYIRAFNAGRIKKQPEMQVERPAASALKIKADHAIGHHAGAVGIDRAIEVAKETGMGAASVTDSTHFGAAAYFGLRAAEQDCLGFAFTNADALVKAFNASEKFFGTNPICFTAPLANEEPYCLDMATSLTSWNNLKNHRRADKPIPDNWAYDAQGNPITNPHDAASLSPIGGYKGFGLGMMIDILCATLVGGIISKDLLAMYDAPIEARRSIGHFFMAIDISKFSDVNTFKNNLQSMVDRIRQLPMDGNNEPPMVAGDPQKKTYLHRIEHGIPMMEVIFDEYLQVSELFQKAVIGEKVAG